MRLRLAVVAATLAASACQTWAPTWSEVTGWDFVLGLSADQSDVDIVRVDDQSVGMGRRGPGVHAFKLTPGRHRVEVGRGPALRDRKFLAVEFAPCRRYYIVRQFASPTDHDDWTPVVARIETISGCRLP